MAYLVGALVDVSGSMKAHSIERIDVNGGEWARSIFQVIDDLIKYDLSSQNKVFALAVGASCGTGVFDILSTIENVQIRNAKRTTSQYGSKTNIVDAILGLLEQNGAIHVRKWAPSSIVCNVIDEDSARILLCELQTSNEFCRRIVARCLPNACKDWGMVDEDPTGLFSFFQGAITSAVTTFRQASEEEVEEAIDKAKVLLKSETEIQLFKNGRKFSIQKARTIVHGVAHRSTLTDERAKELLRTIEPYIYGRTPMYKSLQDALHMFPLYSSNASQSNVLVVLSDGQPTDQGNVLQVAQSFKERNIIVVSCLITKSTNIVPKSLYSSKLQHWGEGACFLFQLSSALPTQMIPRTILLKRGWHIDIENNETKLFLQVNHPQNIHDVCDLARNVVCNQDSLADLLVSTSLDIYINQDRKDFKAKYQKGGTCYANASAATVHLAMKRILGRDEGYPDFHTLRDEMIKRYGIYGEDPLCVLQEICPKYRLRCRQIDVADALEAVTKNRPVVASFWLTENENETNEWDHFSEFYKKHPKGILTKKDLDITKRSKRDKLVGHSVVLTSFNSQCLRLMNSWGSDWGDQGFFRVENAGILNLKFIDVFWYESDLSQAEKIYYQSHGAEVAKALFEKLKCLQSASYKCPICDKSSNVTRFTGTLSEAICPRCEQRFKVEGGNILALNVYLTSISH